MMSGSIELFQSATNVEESLDGLGSGEIRRGVRWYVFSRDLPGIGQTTFLLSSDRALIHVSKTDNRGTATLSNGITARDLCVSEFRSWSYESMQEYLSGKAGAKSWAEMFEAVREVLEKSIYTDRDTYLLLSLSVLVSHFTDQFRANPFLHLTASGPGAGKSHAANVAIRLSFNGCQGERVASFGKASSAAIFKSLALRTTICLDDAEVLHSQAPTPLRVGLLVSYKKVTSVQVLVERGKPKQYRLYGMKFITSINSLDPVLDSRSISIQMKSAPAGYVPEEIPESQFQSVRDLLHVSSMTPERITEVDQALKEVEADSALNGRWGEITAGLRCIAKLVGVEDELVRVLHGKRPVTASDAPLDLREVVLSLFKVGFSAISVLQVWTLLESRGYHMSLTALGLELSKLGLLRARGNLVVHGIKSRLLYPNRRLQKLIKLSADRRPRSWCRQSHKKVLDPEICSRSGCAFHAVCPIRRKYQ